MINTKKTLENNGHSLVTVVVVVVFVVVDVVLVDVVLVPKLKRQEVFIYFYVTSLKKCISLLVELDVDVVVVSDTIVIVSDAIILVSEVIALVSDVVVVVTTKMNFLL
jgi:hypothetical protein